MKLLIHIKLNNGESYEVVSDVKSLHVGVEYLHVRDHQLSIAFTEIKELIIKPLSTDTSN